MRNLIIGIDPGTTTAICIMDFKGNLISLKSEKNFSASKVSTHLQEFGQPVIIAIDTVKVPELVEKIKANFNAVLFKLEKDPSRKEKIEITNLFLEKNENINLENWHERSALAAAISAYNFYENKFRQIERMAKEGGFEERVEEIKRKVVQGVSVTRVLGGLG